VKRSAGPDVSSTSGLRELVGRRELLLILVERQLRLRAKRSIVGVAWPIIAPLLLLALYAFVFGRVFDVPVSDYPGFLFAGLLPWTFLVQSAHDGLQSISFEPDLVRRAPFPYVYLPLARVIVMTGPFLLLLVGFIIWRAIGGDLNVQVLPLLLVPLASVVLLVAALTMLLALVDVFNRDIRYVLNNVFTVWFFLAPIVYTQRMTEQHLEWLERVDPMAWVISQFRDVLYWGRSPGVAALVALPLASAIAFLVGLAVFRRVTVGLAKYV
jgi:lipopolysaccharide transport system permease protein